MKSSHPKRIILAVDLKAEDLSLTQRIISALRQLTKDDATIIEPVSILNREDSAIGNVLRSRIGTLRTATERHLGDQLAEIGLKNLAPPKVLFADGSSTQRAVTALLNHAKKTKADLIAVSSHSRKGAKRFFLGSFAETLSLQSSIPILVVNPYQREVKVTPRTILFPTDFSAKSKEGLHSVCKAFEKQKPRIVLFHNYVFPVRIYMEPFISYPVPKSVIDEDIKATEKIGKAWCAEVRAKGISCEFVMDRRSSFVPEGILSAIRRHKVAIVAMVSNTGKIGAAFLGSATREVLRSSPRPVWVVHPEKKSAGKNVLPLKKDVARTTFVSEVQAGATR